MSKDFLGREQELQLLQSLLRRKQSTLFACTGRRRIGKSRLVNEFSKSFNHFFEFQGLPPHPDQNNQDQLHNFSAQLSRQSKLPEVVVSDWNKAFELLASQVSSEGSTLVLLDEISWMGRYDKDFPGKLKIFWDTVFSKFPMLVIGLCGSVSSWINENILNNTSFVGRISLQLNLQELSLRECGLFWKGDSQQIADFEKLKILSVTGGVPKYLEEINPLQTADENISRLCFTKGGFLYNEMPKIFNDSFDPSRAIYKSIVESLSERHKSLSEIARSLNIAANGALSGSLDHVCQAGFIRRDRVWKFSGKEAKSARYRISDNYLRFYLRCIEQQRAKIEQGATSLNFSDMPNWRSIIGLQFENLVYNNINLIIEKLDLTWSQIISVGPLIQRKNNKNNGSCQIDLLILTKFDTAYICEIKFRKRVGSEVRAELERKLKILQRPKYLSIRPVLIYAGELSEDTEFDDYFYKAINLLEVF